MTPSWSDRWQRIRGDFTLKDLLVDATGKGLVGMGLGVLFADALRPYAWCAIGTGIILSALVKAKHWKRFWG